MEKHFEALVQGLIDEKWAMVDDFIPKDKIDILKKDILSHFNAGDFNAAGIGWGSEHTVKAAIRSDKVLWLDSGNQEKDSFYRYYISMMNDFKDYLNRELYLGIKRFESHLTVYEPGAFYKKHVDQLKGANSRVVSCIFYLNENWQSEDGGQLRIYPNETDEVNYTDVLPIYNRIVVMLSDDVYHEVRPSFKKRLSITGWMRADDTLIPL
ncbi:MAG: 2OG-Fe(II) oxygenase [Cyclobacteriaceae bacterium]|nr:2OG-Fe(II) oxygenase [Cyclobacteriaceae bacterium]MCH8516471.1 2OG-Fe(II) oxygenase [Cyclobacteriaceae bacterium]